MFLHMMLRLLFPCISSAYLQEENTIKVLCAVKCYFMVE
jgi:hypothetical protein